MTRDPQLVTRTPPTGRGPAGSDSEAAAAGGGLDQAQTALERARRMREQVERVLGGLDIQDARNSGGQ